MKSNTLFLLSFVMILFSACDKTEVPSTTPKLIVKLNVDKNQIRLGNTGAPEEIPDGNAGQNPIFHQLSAHYLEFAPTAITPLGKGEVLYHAPETTKGGDNAVDFDKAIVVAPNETFLEIPIDEISPGNYEWVRLSLSYQNYDVTFYHNNIPYTGTIASFVGFNNYISNFTLKNKQVTLNENKKQGYWGFETLNEVLTGQAPEGATTVPNPLFSTSPIPAGSCVVTGAFDDDLVITGDETEDIVVTMSLSVNKSFEWKDENGNGKWDIDANENVVDMGLRGLIPSYQ